MSALVNMDGEFIVEYRLVERVVGIDNPAEPVEFRKGTSFGWNLTRAGVDYFMAQNPATKYAIVVMK